MMTNNWYKKVSATESLTQGDIIFDCPVSVWTEIPLDLKRRNELETIQTAVRFKLADVIVMTQACDLENNHVKNVALCPHISLTEFKLDWERAMTNQGDNPTEKAWKKQVKGLKDGYVWNKSLLNSSIIYKQTFEHRVVDFYDIYTIPKTFLEALLRKRKKSRPRLLPPYRENLSQSFARFYMRVGLPTPINKVP
jgi:hypothetical protein